MSRICDSLYQKLTWWCRTERISIRNFLWAASSAQIKPLARPFYSGFVKTLVFCAEGRFSQPDRLLRACRPSALLTPQCAFCSERKWCNRPLPLEGSMWSTQRCPQALGCHSSLWQQPTCDVTLGLKRKKWVCICLFVSVNVHQKDRRTNDRLTGLCWWCFQWHQGKEEEQQWCCSCTYSNGIRCVTSLNMATIEAFTLCLLRILSL